MAGRTTMAGRRFCCNKLSLLFASPVVLRTGYDDSGFPDFLFVPSIMNVGLWV